jgi:hypothetical protein
VNTRRLLPLGLAVTVLLALAGIASHGRPLAGSRGQRADCDVLRLRRDNVASCDRRGVASSSSPSQRVRRAAAPRFPQSRQLVHLAGALPRMSSSTGFSALQFEQALPGSSIRDKACSPA